MSVIAGGSSVCYTVGVDPVKYRKIKMTSMASASDSAYVSYTNLDVVDEAWEADCLSDDEIDILAAADFSGDAGGTRGAFFDDEGDGDVTLMGAVGGIGASGGAAGDAAEGERWTDLGLDVFLVPAGSGSGAGGGERPFGSES